MGVFADLAKAAVDQFETRTTPFYKIDAVNYVKRNRYVTELFDRIRTSLPKKFDVRGELLASIERDVLNELHRKTATGWRIFKSFPDPEAREGKHRLFLPLKRMTLVQLEGAVRQVRRERKEMVRKEERYEILIEVLKTAGRAATVGDVIDLADAEIARRHA